ncbi:MAG: hypothetical protein ISS77_08680 [Phycisphaerae bacterium]|nr:hypothetical protein [Phycisphaerae bacterium]
MFKTMITTSEQQIYNLDDTVKQQIVEDPLIGTQIQYPVGFKTEQQLLQF